LVHLITILRLTKCGLAFCSKVVAMLAAPKAGPYSFIKLTQ
jgi:hypothetical protein